MNDFLDNLPSLSQMFKLIVFLILVGQAYARGLDIRCGCYFFEGEASLGLRKIIENIILTGMSVILMLFIIKSNSRESDSE